MKKIILVTAVTLFSLSSFSQAKDSARKDSMKTYAIIMNEKEINSIISLIKEADEKPSIINSVIQFISSRTQLISAPANTEIPKKDSTNKAFKTH